MNSDRRWIRSSRVLLRDKGGKLGVRAASILISDGRIVAVDAGDTPSPPPPDVPVHDYGSDLVAPAFVNPHTHLAMSFMRGLFGDQASHSNAIEQLYFRLESALDAADVRAFTRMGAYESLLHGVGFVWDHFYFGAAVAAGLRDVGLAGVVTPTLQDVRGPGLGRLEQALDETLQIAADSALVSAGIGSALGPHATDTVSPALFSRIAELSERHRLPLHLHLAQSADELSRVYASCGTSPVELLRRTGILALTQPLLLAHGIYLSIADAKAATSDTGRLVACPSSQFQFAFPARVDRWVEAEIPFLVATDNGNCNDGLNLQKELRSIAGFRTIPCAFGSAMTRLLASGEPQYAARVARERQKKVQSTSALGEPDYLLRKVLDDAGAMHPRLRAGVIEPGALANLAVWNLTNPAFWPAIDPVRALALGDISPALRHLIVMGRAVGEDGDVCRSILASSDYRVALSEAEARLKAVLRRAGV